MEHKYKRTLETCATLSSAVSHLAPMKSSCHTSFGRFNYSMGYDLVYVVCVDKVLYLISTVEDSMVCFMHCSTIKTTSYCGPFLSSSFCCWFSIDH